MSGPLPLEMQSIDESELCPFCSKLEEVNKEDQEKLCQLKVKTKSKKKLSLGESNPGLPRLSVLMTSGNHDH
ncbi:hypothetical protein N7481_007478 [Penicillium waksmanii]|uniref:uncharacterized protein n=1 Tax=Penicillium waksmanii TaxID=69791 RepID=UPI0025484782|nr:uncharacterized protein N7481_007478 [Penicillium waksmanii]KAJ5980180.1 hypothetical protein N7481_007478 [Penicillium waksmanii]